MDVPTTMILLLLLITLCTGGIQENKNNYYDDDGDDGEWEIQGGRVDNANRFDGGNGGDRTEKKKHKTPPELELRSTDLIKDNMMQYKAFEGHNILLRCPVKSRSLPFFCEWRKENELIHQGWMRFRVDELKMKIKDIRMEDEGVYTCLAINGYGQVSVSMQLHVFAQDDNTRQPYEGNIRSNKTDDREHIQTPKTFTNTNKNEIKIKKKNNNNSFDENINSNINTNKTNITEENAEKFKEQRENGVIKYSESGTDKIKTTDLHHNIDILMVVFLLAPILIAITVIVILLKYISKGNHLQNKEHKNSLKERIKKIDENLINSKKNILKKIHGVENYDNLFATIDSYESERV